MNSRRYLFLVDQPLQADMAAQIANKILNGSLESVLNLAFTDYYTFFLRRDYLAGFTSAWNGKIFTQEEIYLGWQQNRLEKEFDKEFLITWEKLYGKNRSLEQLQRTNQLIFGNERDYYQRQMSEDWKTKILYDTILWSSALFSEVKPDVIISIERSTLANNLIFEMAREKKIQFLTIMPTRLGKRWILVDDFGYGMDESNVRSILSNYSDEINKSKASKEIKRLLQDNQAAYISIASQISKQFNTKKSKPLRTLIRELRLLAGRVYGRLFIQRKERLTQSKRLNENFFKLSIYEFKYLMYNSLRGFGLKFWGKSKPPKSKYFYWALHYRPEGSVSVLGDGRDEIEELLKVAREIPSDHCLVVKEHPGMFGTRKVDFYHKLRKHSRVILVDPFCSTKELITGASGVIGISGTVLLEAAMMDKPSYAIGKPEFIDFIFSNKLTGLANFIDMVAKEKFPSPREKILPYVAYMLDKGIDHDSSVLAESDYPKSAEFSQKMAELIINYSGNDCK
jgi:hypothetical protein